MSRSSGKGLTTEDECGHFDSGRRPHDSYAVADALSRAAHRREELVTSVASGSPQEGAFRLVTRGLAYSVIVRPLRYDENPDHPHEWGPWKDDPAGVIRECVCGAVDWRPEG